ncbi:hypothetical protein BN2476_110264 [Paraburkholderia piptadeniae]|uniref:Uncharacterized protein n=1 Tax=Paraburkholderia piptadeniae TaxID=1701573 RepID=A0A1N7RQP9_9BURK|nr:hypothetical protein BN2476_110264 [Paraburkholderia piptadeniae]
MQFLTLFYKASAECRLSSSSYVFHSITDYEETDSCRKRNATKLPSLLQCWVRVALATVASQVYRVISKSEQAPSPWLATASLPTTTARQR